jgi:O-acetyl-ADP-ribose deacetylase (regulator of RNase III)
MQYSLGRIFLKMNIADRIEIIEGDLTEMDVDAIVNAANNDLQLGGGVAGAIRRKGGPEIQKECDAIGQVPVGGAAITTGGKLKARYVRIAAQKGLKTIAFPAVGTGIAEFPLRECAEIMLREVAKHFEQPTSLEKIDFVLFDKEALTSFASVWTELQAKSFQ